MGRGETSITSDVEIERRVLFECFQHRIRSMLSVDDGARLWTAGASRWTSRVRENDDVPNHVAAIFFLFLKKFRSCLTKELKEPKSHELGVDLVDSSGVNWALPAPNRCLENEISSRGEIDSPPGCAFWCEKTMELFPWTKSESEQRRDGKKNQISDG